MPGLEAAVGCTLRVCSSKPSGTICLEFFLSFFFFVTDGRFIVPPSFMTMNRSFAAPFKCRLRVERILRGGFRVEVISHNLPVKSDITVTPRPLRGALSLLTSPFDTRRFDLSGRQSVSLSSGDCVHVIRRGFTFTSPGSECSKLV